MTGDNFQGILYKGWLKQVLGVQIKISQYTQPTSICTMYTRYNIQFNSFNLYQLVIRDKYGCNDINLYLLSAYGL